MSGDEPSDLKIGQSFEGKYQILRELGRGGFGMVYLAYQENMDRHVALKVLRNGVSDTAASAKERFLREVRIIAKLRHPNTVTIHDFGETADGCLYMTLEYVEGETLKQIMKREGPQDALRAADLSRQIARSLSEAHRHGVVHRDLKPANIMITNIDNEKDFVKVLDFGVARLLDPKTSDLTSVGLPEGERELIGTPRYMSPEQVRGESLTGASDIYGVGLILYEMMCGEPAVQGDSTMALITQQISPEPLRLPYLHTLDPMMQDIIRITTTKAVQDRFQTADQISDALEQVIFNLRRQRNLTGSQSNEILQSYQSQLTSYPTGFNPKQTQPPGWQQPVQPGYYPSGQHPNPNPNPNYQSGGYPVANSGAYPPVGGSGAYPPVGGSGAYPPVPGSGAYPPVGGSGAYPPVQQGYPPYQPGTPEPFIQQTGYQPLAPSSATPSGHIPVQQSSGGFQIERNEEFEDFQPTMERSAISLPGLGERSNELDSFTNLPPPPEDSRPFYEEPKAPPVAEHPAPVRPKPPSVDDDNLVAFSFSMIKLLLLVSGTALASYIAFIVIGAMLGTFIDGGLRLVVTFIVVGAVPLLSAISEASHRERFRVIRRPMDRGVKVLTISLVFLCAATIFSSFISSDGVIQGLRTEPNWFLSSPDSTKGFAGLNRRVSSGVASGMSGALSALGMRRAGPMTGGPKPPPATRTPASTRSDQPAAQPDRSAAPVGKKKKGDYVDW